MRRAEISNLHAVRRTGIAGALLGRLRPEIPMAQTLSSAQTMGRPMSGALSGCTVMVRRAIAVRRIAQPGSGRRWTVACPILQQQELALPDQSHEVLVHSLVHILSTPAGDKAGTLSSLALPGVLGRQTYARTWPDPHS